MASDKTRKQQQATDRLLAKVKANKIGFDDVEDLREVLRFHEYRYYILNDPLVSDFEYDSLYKALEKLVAGW